MPSFFMQYKKYFAIGIGIILVISLYFISKPSDQQAQVESLMTEKNPQIEPAISSTSETTQQKIPPQQLISTAVVVDVKGAVKKPGIYRMDQDARVMEAIEEAGGYTKSANPKLINHAAKLQDEMVIYIPRKGEKIPEQLGGAASVVSPSTNQAASGGASDQQAQVNLNTADETELQTLSGIGPAKSAAIIAYRTQTGPFQTIEDLKKVSGFGEKTFERLQPLITVQ